MTKSDLVTGMMVECMNGNLYCVMTDTCMERFPAILKALDRSGYVDLSHYTDDLTVPGSPEFTIKKVSIPVSPSYMLDTKLYETVWERV